MNISTSYVTKTNISTSFINISTSTGMWIYYKRCGYTKYINRLSHQQTFSSINFLINKLSNQLTFSSINFIHLQLDLSRLLRLLVLFSQIIQRHKRLVKIRGKLKNFDQLRKKKNKFYIIDIIYEKQFGGYFLYKKHPFPL